jgi:pimeloyl-ACP methyl ester carboxylesterase
MIRLARWVLLPLLLAMALGIPSVATAQSPSLEPHEDPAYGLSSVIPSGWQRVGPGLYTRGQGASDPTVLALQSAPVDPDALWASLLPQFGLTETPEPLDTRETDVLTWTLYEFDTTGSVADAAIANADGTSYLVLLVSPTDERDALREAVFLPAVDALVPLEEAPTPSPGDLPYRAELVSFPGGSEGVTLAGTLTIPEGDGPYPVAVLMSGSGPQDRDESLAPVSLIKPFALIADALARSGIASLRYDDRGVGESTGDYNSADIDDLTADGKAALDFVATHPEVDPERIGMIGHSEGGVYLATLAATDPRISFGVGLAAPATNGRDLLIAQNIAIVRSQGLPEEEVEHTRRFVERAFDAVLGGDDEAVEEAIRESFGALFDRRVGGTDEEREAFVEQQVRTQLPVLTSAWYRSLLARNFQADWEQVTIPILGLFGGKDVQVPAEQEAPALREALDRAGNTDFEIVTLPDANHLFQQAVTGAIDEYGTLEAEFTPDLLPTLVDWVRARTDSSAV